MVERIVLIKLHEPYANDSGRDEVIQESKRVLPTIEGVKTLRCGVPAEDKTAGSWDIQLSLTFNCMTCVDTYQADPIHRDYVDTFLKDRMSFIKAWNFEHKE
jgi:hypothetical protein